MAHKTLQLIRRLIIVRLAWSIDRRSRIGARDWGSDSGGRDSHFCTNGRLYIIRNYVYALYVIIYISNARFSRMWLRDLRVA